MKRYSQLFSQFQVTEISALSYIISVSWETRGTRKHSDHRLNETTGGGGVGVTPVVFTEQLVGSWDHIMCRSPAVPKESSQWKRLSTIPVLSGCLQFWDIWVWAREWTEQKRQFEHVLLIRYCLSNVAWWVNCSKNMCPSYLWPVVTCLFLPPKFFLEAI